MAVVMVFLGGGLGSLARYGLAYWLHGWKAGFPLATFLANASSCLILGLLLGLQLREPWQESYRLLLLTGFCGGFSTFSTFSNETLYLLQNGQSVQAFLYVGASLLVGLGLIFLGLRIVSATL